MRGGWPGVWQQPNPPNPQPFGDAMLTLGGHPHNGEPRADTILVTYGNTRRSTNGGATWSPPLAPLTWYTLYEIPAGLPHAGRLLVGNLAALSDDRGATWRDSLYDTTEIPVEFYAFLALPGPDALPGAASGRDPAAPPDWPAGRVIGTGYNALAVLSDTGGDDWRLTGHGVNPGFRGQAMTLIRRPDTHPLGPGPRLLMVASGEIYATGLYTSDDAGETWTRRAWLTEPGDGPGWPSPAALLALPEPGETDRGAGGRALALLARGHLYETTDGGETWQVVGRIPGIRPSGDPEGFTRAWDMELGPDGHLYVSVSHDGWVWRTVDPFVVASEGTPAPASGLSLSVSPNPSSGAVTFSLTSREPQRVRVVVTDVTGREVAAVEAWASPAAESLSLDVSSWAAGVYVVQMSAETYREHATARFTVAR